MGKRVDSPLARHRKSLRLKGYPGIPKQALMALRAGFPNSQGQASKIERGYLPENSDEVAAWARAYRLTVKQFITLVEASRGLSWELPLWKYAREEDELPLLKRAEITEIDTKRDGKLALAYTEAPVIGETEQQRRQA